ELEAGSAAQDAITGSALNVLGIQFLRHLHDSCLGGLQRIVKTLQHSHRKNYLAILMGLEQAHQVGSNFPDQVGFRLYICICLLLQLIHRHKAYTPSLRSISIMSPTSTWSASHTFTTTSMLTFSFFAIFVMDAELSPVISCRSFFFRSRSIRSLNSFL